MRAPDRREFALDEAQYAVLTAIIQYGLAVSTTPQMTCFRGVKVCRKWLQGKVTIKIYSLTTS